MIIVSGTLFHVFLPCGQRPFNQEKALVGAFSVIVKTDYETDGSFHSTNGDPPRLAASVSPPRRAWERRGWTGRVRVMNAPKIEKLIVNVVVAGGRSAPAQRHSGSSVIIVNTEPAPQTSPLDVSIRTLHTRA